MCGGSLCRAIYQRDNQPWLESWSAWQCRGDAALNSQAYFIWISVILLLDGANNKRCTNFYQQLRICNESFIKTYQHSVPPGHNPLGYFSQRKTKQQFLFLTSFEHKEAHVFIFRLSKIIHLRIRKACKIFKECFISCRHPCRNGTVQPLFVEYFDVKCLNCQDHSVSAEENSWEWFDLFSNLQ